jgi:hypothetical protein
MYAQGVAVSIRESRETADCNILLQSVLDDLAALHDQGQVVPGIA